MKKLVLVILLLCCYFGTQESIIVNQKQLVKVDFRTSLEYILKHEGYYVNHPLDLGKETYSGISRVYNPNWYGWRYIDIYKDTSDLKWNTHIPQCDFWVLDYYLDIWVKERFYELKDQQVANYVFDFRVNGTIGTRIIQKSINELGFKIPVTNIMDSVTIHSINKIKKSRFLKKVKHKREIFYRNIVKRDSSQAIFLNHWLKRTHRI